METLTEKTPMTPYLACSYIEGYCEGENASDHDKLEAFAYLIRTGIAWTLQGSIYGRPAKRLIENGYISESGEILIDLE